MGIMRFPHQAMTQLDWQRLLRVILMAVMAVWMTACGSSPPNIITPAPSTTTQPLTTTDFSPLAQQDLRIASGQRLYVPAYAEVFLGSSRLTTSLSLSVTLAIHNTDIQHPITLRSIRYYDTEGNLIREYLSEPLTVRPLATTGFIVEDSDKSAGWGANFIVEWTAATPVYEPIIEAIMVSTQGTHGISMISQGRVISQILSPDYEEIAPDVTLVPTNAAP